MRNKNNKNPTIDIKTEPPSIALADNLRKIFPIVRLRTGTPPRIDKRTIDYTGLEPQESDVDIKWFNFENEFNGYHLQNGQITCHLTATNEETHRICAANRHQLHDLKEGDNGPRYCPSIERKLKMFPDKQYHYIWLEPEGIDSNIVYPNGISTGYPFDI